MNILKQAFKLRTLSLIGLLLILSSARPVDEGWQSVKEIEGVKYYYRLGDCNYNNFLVLKVENTTSSAVTFSWEGSVGDDVLQETSPKVSFTIQPNETLEGDCMHERLHQLTFVYNQLYENPTVTVIINH